MNIQDALTLCKSEAYGSRARETARTYGNGIDCFRDYLLDRKITLSDPLDAVTINHFIYFPGWLLEHNFAKGTVRVYIAGAKFLMNWMVLHDVINPDYHDTLRYQIAMKNISAMREDRFVRTPEEYAVEKITAAVKMRDTLSPIHERDIAVIEFLASSGCRNNEAASLHVRDINLTSRSGTVTGKGSKDRKVGFSQDAANALQSYWTARGYSDGTHPIFTRHDPGAGRHVLKLTPTSIRRIVDECVVLAGLNKGSFTPHYFRHAFAIKMLRATHDLALVQDLLGHATPASTRIYAKIFPDEMMDAHHKVF